jgi:Entner-Doudoroff aldolase
MPTCSPEATLEALAAARCSAILRTPHASAVGGALRAAVDGGFRIVEVTLTTPNALAHVESLATDPALVVGAGTVLTTEDVAAAADAGARFVVSPVVDPAVIRAALDRGLVAVPGCYTPTEMWTAHRAGAQVVKLFPGPADGPGFVRAVLGPLPFLRIFPTGGVTLENAAAHLAAGAFGVGFVASLFAPDDVAAERFDAIGQRARAMVRAVEAAPRAGA